MSINQILWSERQSFIQATHQSFIYGILDTWKRCERNNKTPQEPDFVAGIVLESFPLMYRAFSSIFKKQGINIAMSSVYCHQTPKVSYSGMSKSSCELGDLLIVFTHKDRGHIQRNAILYQAKMSSKQPHRISKSELDQLTLYKHWPDFEYVKSPPLTGQRRSVSPKVCHPGAQYMLIDDRSYDDPLSGLLGLSGTYPVGSCMPDQYLQDHNHMPQEIFEFFIFRSGRSFESQANTIDGWSQIVWDLLSTSLRKAFQRKRSGRHNAPRQIGDQSDRFDGMSLFMTTSRSSITIPSDILGRRASNALFFHGDDLPPIERKNDYGNEGPENGISIVLIETSEGEFEE